MNVLDSPLEALAINYVSFGLLTVVHNLWTWIAVITAAVSFWRIRAAGAGTLKSEPHTPVLDRNTIVSQPALIVSPPKEEPASASASASAEGTRGEVDGVTKGKYTVYYYEDEQELSDGDLTLAGNWEEGNNEVEERESDDWETMRMGDLGWYSLQDLTVLNGNVVRFWEESSSISRSCGVW